MPHARGGYVDKIAVRTTPGAPLSLGIRQVDVATRQRGQSAHSTRARQYGSSSRDVDEPDRSSEEQLVFALGRLQRSLGRLPTQDRRPAARDGAHREREGEAGERSGACTRHQKQA